MTCSCPEAVCKQHGCLRTVRRKQEVKICSDISTFTLQCQLLKPVVVNMQCIFLLSSAMLHSVLETLQ